MQCDVCKAKEAEVFLTQIVDGKMQKVNLCKACSNERGVDDPAGFALTELLAGLGTSTETEEASTGKGPQGAGSPVAAGSLTTGEGANKCPVCGFTLGDFKKTGRLGCSECYQTLAGHLGNLLQAMHKGTRHTGKTPARVLRHHEIAERMKGLRDDLVKAVKDENYEGAASLRDQIQKLTEN